jgi:hypothetical protein
VNLLSLKLLHSINTLNWVPLQSASGVIYARFLLFSDRVLSSDYDLTLNHTMIVDLGASGISAVLSIAVSILASPTSLLPS